MVSVLALRKHELGLRIARLPREVQTWIQAARTEIDKNAYFSQLRAIEVLTSEFHRRQQALLQKLDPAGDPRSFYSTSVELSLSTARSWKTWDFFREKLDLRHSAHHREPLWVADTIAWNCHRTALDRAVQFGILNSTELREPPLVYCSAEYSPATWVRGTRPIDGRDYALGEARLPIPVIEIPWDCLGSSWQFLALHHEVGHDLEADLKLRPALLDSLRNHLHRYSVPHQRTNVWISWVGEIFADFCALQLAGPAYTDVLMDLLLLPENAVKVFNPADPHPTPYLRILLNCAYIRTLGNASTLKTHAAGIEEQWKALYGEDSGDAELDKLYQDFAVVFEALLDAPLAVLKQHSMRDLIPFAEADDARIRNAMNFFETGFNLPGELPVRHSVSAARQAIGRAVKTGNLTDETCVAIHERVLQYVRDHAPKGLRGGGPDAHEKFIASYADTVFAKG